MKEGKACLNLLTNRIVKSSVITPYMGLVFVLCIAFNIHISGDTVALIKGLNHALDCLKCMPPKVPCGAEVVHFPVFQYVVAVPFKLIGVQDEMLLKILGFLNVLWAILSAYVFWKVGAKQGGKAGGHLTLLIFFSGYLLWYMTATFNEMASFALFALLAFSVIDGWKIVYISLIAFLCTITKEIAFPFVLYFMLLSYAAYEYKDKDRVNIILSVRNFSKKYLFPIIATFMGVVLNAMFNYFRFGTIENVPNLWPKLFTPWPYVPKFFMALVISPSGGLLFLWFSLCIFLLAAIIYSLNQKTIGKWIILLSVLGLFIANFGLARWYSPFGWYAWGPRLTLPFLGSVMVIGVYIGMPYLLSRYRNIEIKYFQMLLFLIATISSLPNLAVLLNEGAFFSKMFGVPTKIEMASGVKPFTIQTATAEQYMRASIEGFCRNIIWPVTIDVVFQYMPIVLIWLLSIYYVSRAVSVNLTAGESPCLEDVNKARHRPTSFKESGLIAINHCDGSKCSKILKRVIPVLLAMIFIIIGGSLVLRTTLTGDEGRYLYYSISYARQGNFHLSLQEWRKYLSLQYPKILYKHLIEGNGNGIVLEKENVPAHSVFLSIILSPLIKFIPDMPFSRIATLLIAVFSLLILYYWLLSNGFGFSASLLAVVIGGGSLPFMAYSAVFYAEIWLAFCFILGLILSLNPTNLKKIIACSLLIVMIPFVHLRGVAVAMVLAAVLLYQIIYYTSFSKRVLALMIPFIIFIIGAYAFYRVNLQLYGNILGSVNTARPIINIEAINYLFSNFRHGLFVFSPVFIFGIGGLLIAANQRNIVGYAGLLALVLVVIASAGPDAGECPPARFMVQAIPVLIIGLAFWIKNIRKKGIAMSVLFTISLLWTFVNSIYYIVSPTSYLENRTQCMTCDFLLGKVGFDPVVTSGYCIINQQNQLVHNLENFPLNTRIVEIQIELRHSEKIAAIDVMAGNNLGHWTTKPISSLWNLAVVTKNDNGFAIENSGKRLNKMSIPSTNHLNLWIADNGCFSGYPLLSITLENYEGKLIRAIAKYKTN